MTTTWLICIDDTDDIGTKGTGEIAEEIMALIVAESAVSSVNKLGIKRATWVTRHQLFVHPDIPYTSHNSAMCFELESDLSLSQIKQLCIAHLVAESAAVADPGLAIVDKHTLTADDCHQLIAFGVDAKQMVKTKNEAYQLAKTVNVDLSEHGGTGQGVIGALAGIGLRLSGNDGRLKGQVSVGLSAETPSVLLSVDHITEQCGLDGVMDVNGQMLGGHEQILLSGKVKAVFHGHLFLLLVYQVADPQTGDIQWCNALRQQLKKY
ncbi:DNA-binding protein [Shewanella saliphila]|uniref:DNA-binding protein n=1 Tax=Shewanella saliphila TaxID=2282698 RepID=A0ABQ2QB14_9GAMM|nr:DNA-binding protein [Shewanella saliphila]MCL1102823.1 DNA-binding protein [Shewanella saliphila]GGP62213.1 hypothetical protein GCM10009409_30000 [Shewanella saliphila]